MTNSKKDSKNVRDNEISYFKNSIPLALSYAGGVFFGAQTQGMEFATRAVVTLPISTAFTIMMDDLSLAMPKILNGNSPKQEATSSPSYKLALAAASLVGLCLGLSC